MSNKSKTALKLLPPVYKGNFDSIETRLQKGVIYSLNQKTFNLRHKIRVLNPHYKLSN